MKKETKLWLYAIAATVLFLSGIPQAFAKDDWEYWPAINMGKDLNEKINLGISLQSRFKNDMNKVYYGGAQLASAFKLNECFSLTPSYCFIKYDSKGHFEEEHRYILDAGFSWKTEKMQLGQRSRFEYRNLPASDGWRYRCRFKAGFPLKLYTRSLKPYFSEEIFYDERKNEFNQNRFSLGTVLKINERVSLDFYYLLRSDKKGNDWSNRNALGTSINLKF